MATQNLVAALIIFRKALITMRSYLLFMVLLGMVVSGCNKSVRVEIENSMPEVCEVWTSAKIATIQPGSRIRMAHPIHLDPSTKWSISLRGKRYYYDWNPPLQSPLRSGDHVFARISGPEEIRVWEVGRTSKGVTMDSSGTKLRLLRVVDAH